MTTRITILSENTAFGPEGVLGEHGFSALVERGDLKLLFDTGQSVSLARNAAILGKDLSTVDTVVLSHGHYDHTGGLCDLLRLRRDVEIIAHPDVFDSKYAVSEENGRIESRFIGIKYRREHLESCGARFVFLTEYKEIRPRVFFSGEVARRTEFERPDDRLKVRRDDRFVPDPLKDDASLLIETSSGPLVLLGCAHTGVVNILDHFSHMSGHRSFHAVIGGTHLGPHGMGEQLDLSMDAFDRYDLGLIGLSHCTGQEAAAACFSRFRERFEFASVGWSKEF